MIKIIYEDNEKLIVDKKAGKREGEEGDAAIINRLDRPVAG